MKYNLYRSNDVAVFNNLKINKIYRLNWQDKKKSSIFPKLVGGPQPVGRVWSGDLIPLFFKISRLASREDTQHKFIS